MKIITVIALIILIQTNIKGQIKKGGIIDFKKNKQ